MKDAETRKPSLPSSNALLKKIRPGFFGTIYYEPSDKFVGDIKKNSWQWSTGARSTDKYPSNYVSVHPYQNIFILSWDYEKVREYLDTNPEVNEWKIDINVYDTTAKISNESNKSSFRFVRANRHSSKWSLENFQIKDLTSCLTSIQKDGSNGFKLLEKVPYNRELSFTWIKLKKENKRMFTNRSKQSCINPNFIRKIDINSGNTETESNLLGFGAKSYGNRRG